MKIFTGLFLLVASATSFAQTAEKSQFYQEYEEKMKIFEKKKEMVRKNARIEKNQKIEVEKQKKIAYKERKQQNEKMRKLTNDDTITLFEKLNKGEKNEK